MTEEELAKHDSKTLLQLLLSADARIEVLTAKVAELEACLERQGSGHREDLDEIANVSVERLRRAKAAEAERDRLREALKGLMAHEPDYSDTLWQDAHEVLNGETT